MFLSEKDIQKSASSPQPGDKVIFYIGGEPSEKGYVENIDRDIVFLDFGMGSEKWKAQNLSPMRPGMWKAVASKKTSGGLFPEMEEGKQKPKGKPKGKKADLAKRAKNTTKLGTKATKKWNKAPIHL